VDTSKKISASKVIDAPAEAVFAVLADPNQHLPDGGGMVKGRRARRARSAASGRSSP
jgi:hypothetical protein